MLDLQLSSDGKLVTIGGGGARGYPLGTANNGVLPQLPPTISVAPEVSVEKLNPGSWIWHPVQCLHRGEGLSVAVILHCWT